MGELEFTVTFRVRDAISNTDAACKARVALHKLTDLELLDDYLDKLAEVFDKLPMHCADCGKLAPEWMAYEAKFYGGPTAEEIRHQPNDYDTKLCNEASWQPTQELQAKWEIKDAKKRARRAK